MPVSSPQSSQCADRAHVRVLHDVAYDTRSIEEIVASCLTAMRCPACASGRVPEFDELQDAVACVARQDAAECIA
jgi:hypothetical protein